MPNPRKPPATRQRGARTTDLDRMDERVAEVVSLPDRSMPSPGDWSEQRLAEWRELWSSALAPHLRTENEPALRRLFLFRDEQDKALRRAEVLLDLATSEPLVAGSKGQPVRNPLFAAADDALKLALSVEQKIVTLEDRFGLSPKARLALGTAHEQGVKLATQNALLAERMQEAMSRSVDPRSTADSARALPGDTAAVSS